MRPGLAAIACALLAPMPFTVTAPPPVRIPPPPVDLEAALEEAERGAAVGGTYFSDCRPKKTTSVGEDLTVAGKLWKLSEKLTGASFSV